jgi:tetratricopeptide (TPR) repeat protein
MLQRLAILFELNDVEADQLYRAAAQVAPEFQNLPFPRNPFFTGRETYLEQLDHDLKKSGAVAITQPISISGLGGIGKTQLALEYAHRSYPERYRTVLWVNAASKATLEESYLSVARLLKLPEQGEQKIDDVVQAVKTWLGGHTGWLLILDNVDDLQLARTFFPTKPCGHILLTTRSQILGNIAAPMVLESMEPEEGLLFLLRRSGVLSLGTEPGTLDPTIRKAAAHLVGLLGRHPLALDQAGAYIEEAETSFDAYVQLYHEQHRILLNKRGSLGDEHPETVVVTFEVSCQRACEVCPLAGDVLSFCAFLYPDAIPEELLSQDEHLKLHSMAFDEAIMALGRYSLIKRNAQNKVLSVHRLVQAVRKDGMDKETLRGWEERAVLAINAAFPYVQPGTWLQCERLLPHALLAAQYIETDQVIGEEAGRLLHETASYLRDRGSYHEAEPLYQQAISTRRQQLGPEHPDVASSLNGLGRLYYNQGKYIEAEPFYQRALAIYEQQLGLEHLNVANTLSNLGSLYNDQGKYIEAELLLQRALHIWEQRGPEHPDKAHTLNNLAMIYHSWGKYTEAEPLFQRALRIWEKQLGPEHPNVTIPLHNLGRLYYEQGKYTEAELFYQRALHLWEQQLGPEHPEVAPSLNSLAQLYLEQRKYEQAEPLFQRALHIREKQLGPENPKVAYPLNNLAQLYLEQRKYEQAEPLFQRALHLWEQQLGPEHPNVTYPLDGLAQLYLEQSKYAEAEALLQRALHIREQQLGPEHPETAEIIHNFALLQEMQGNALEAHSLYDRALAIRALVYGPHHPKTVETRKCLIALLYKIGLHEEAAQLEAAQSAQGLNEKDQKTHPED